MRFGSLRFESMGFVPLAFAGCPDTGASFARGGAFAGSREYGTDEGTEAARVAAVSRTIHGQDGGIATVVVSPVNIDQVPPQVKVTGARNGEAADAPGPANLACAATDKLSGLAAPLDSATRRAR